MLENLPNLATIKPGLNLVYILHVFFLAASLGKVGVYYSLFRGGI